MGVANEADAAIAIAMKNGRGLTPIWFAADKATGKIRAAAALFVIISVKTVVKRYTPASTPTGMASGRRVEAAAADGCLVRSPARAFARADVSDRAVDQRKGWVQLTHQVVPVPDRQV